MSLPDLEARVDEIDEELGTLARFTLRNVVGNVGWLSRPHKTVDAAEWAEVFFSEDVQIDRIVLAPVLWNDAVKGPQADGFPLVFEVIAGAAGEKEGRVVARFGAEDEVLPRVAPLVIRIPPQEAGWVRIKSLEMTPCARDGRYLFALSEIMVFSGERNVALHGEVKVSSSIGGYGADAIYKDALVDGLTPFVMDASTGNSSDALLAFMNKGVKLWFTIDLGESCAVDMISIHAADVAEFIPQISAADTGMPFRFLIQGYEKEDFSDAVPLAEFRRDSPYAAGNIITMRFPKRECRYVRFTALEPNAALKASKSHSSLSLAEMEVFAGSRNVSVGKPVLLPNVSNKHRYRVNNETSLTDGLNHFGEILPTGVWMDQLARRHDLERERPEVAAAIRIGYEKQKSLLARLSWLVALLAGGILFIILIDRIIRMRGIAKLKERIAADMHDELGANLHTIGLLSDSANASHESSEEWGALHRRIRALTEQTGQAIRRCSQFVDNAANYTSLIEDMERSVRRITGQFEHSITFEGEEHLERFNSSTRVDIYLFYKECLVNIYRHSQATKFQTSLVALPTEIVLTVSDNGKGMPEELRDGIPRSLLRRARLVRGKLLIEDDEDGGTRVTLKISNRKWWQFWKRKAKISQPVFPLPTQPETP
ncbi:MAG: hypothetical protein ABJZ75_05580 [Luteolibacter sp.]